MEISHPQMHTTASVQTNLTYPNWEVAPSARPKFQQTLRHEVILSGKGLHSGRQVTLRLSPAPINHGVQFLRSDLTNGARLIAPRSHAVAQTQLCTLLTNGQGGEVGTIEHLMASLHALGISNILIDLDSPEVPIFDGSSAPIIEAMTKAGIVQQKQAQTYLRVKRAVRVLDENKSVVIAPHAHDDDKRLLVHFDIDFPSPCIGRQSYKFDLTTDRFIHELSAARTFGFAEQIEALRMKGLAKGGDLNNAIVIENGSVKNPDGLRFENEFVRHKTLDAIGDLFIEGLPLIGVYHGVRAGHEMTNRAMQHLMSDPENFDYIHI